MSIACDGGNKLYKAENCTVPLTPYCSNNKTGTAGTWNVSNAMCLKENGYLDGEANLDDPTGKCNEIRARFPTTYLFWIGIRRQVYKTADKGYPTESNSLTECEFLNGRDFSTMQTNNCKKKYYAVCLVPNNISNISNADQTAREERENNVTDDVGPLVGGVFGGLFLIAGVILLTIIVIRRHQKGKREDQSTLKFESENHTSISELKDNQSTDNDRYPEMNSNDIKEETYYKSQDDYDILGKRRSKIKGTRSENIYNHAESTTNQNHYASAAQVSKRISGEDLYDHTNNSAYGTVSEIDNGNMYSES
ncbi:uncharacterized protein LOC134230770 isoform X2 [Saccostrea cucullata]|uniref:uncharacterized protein LOC134230770 isoform X2 n=1 Tax=Saccostrea cuccullata TaxID=36930 RepID=UPI002ED0A46E